MNIESSLSEARGLSSQLTGQELGGTRRLNCYRCLTEAHCLTHYIVAPFNPAVEASINMISSLAGIRAILEPPALVI